MSIVIDNFSIGLDEVAYCTSLVDFSVDITDTTYDVTTSGTYFMYDGVAVSGTLTPITNGYRLSYATTPSGNFSLIANACNSVGDVAYDEYRFYYGYECTWNKVNYWGPKKQVPISLTADNTALAPNTTTFATYFETRNYEQLYLEATITAEGSGKKDLTASITPQSKYFMYGKTYKFIISGIKDFSGNTLSSRVYTFTIEDE